jgi:hypothetical protein
MSYAIVLEDDASAVLWSLSFDETEAVLDEIDRLALHPTTVSRPGTFPYIGLQVYTFKMSIGGVEREVTIPFLYSQNERELHIMRILIG